MPTPSATRCRTAASVIGVVFFLTDLAGASAATLEAVQSSAIIEEASYALAIDWDGVVARVVATQALVNTGSETEEAIYTFELPAGAAVTGVSVKLPGGATTVPAVVDADAALHFAPGTAELHQKGAVPDIALLRLLGHGVADSGDEVASYELRIYPLPAGKAVTVRTSWVTPLRYHDGRLSLRVPSRGSDANLVNEKIAVTLRPPATATALGAVFGDGKLLSARAGKGPAHFRFAGRHHGDLVIEAVPEFSSYATPRQSRAVASFAAVPITKGFGMVAVSVLAPPPRGAANLSFERVVLVADVSRSMGATGQSASAALATAVLEALPAATRVELVTFDHATRAAFPAFRPNDATTRQAIAAALTPSGLRENGSDLGLALDLTHQLIAADPLAAVPDEGIERGARATNLIVILSDGMVPLDLDAGNAAGRLSGILGECEVAAVTIVPDDAPAPDNDDGVIAALATRTHGRAVAVHAGQVATRSAHIAAEIARPLPLRTLVPTTGKHTTIENDDLLLPERLEAGNGVLRFGWYYGAVPTAVTVVAEAEAGPVRITASRDSALARSTLALVLVGTRLAAHDGDLAGDLGDTLEAAALLALARRTPVVTRFDSLVALDAKDGFARDRIAMMKKWDATTYFRLPPPPELAAGQGFERYIEGNGSLVMGSSTGNSYRRTGELDRDIIGRLIERHVVPKAKVCYDRALRKHPALAGSLVVVIEIARGEIQFAETVQSSFAGSGIEACVTAAAYSIPVPRVSLGDDPETIGVARYPLAFRVRDQKSTVEYRANPVLEDDQIEIDLDDPLGGLD